jgi:glycosyltransferase involved in cell wall biosynthesis
VPGSHLASSVVIPTYNAEAFLDAELSALASQTHPEPFEVVIADNGSTDRSVEVAEAWRDRLPFLRVVDASRARGVSAARNDGIRAATTDVILLCDADDVVDGGWVAAMLRGLEDHDYVGGALDTRVLSTPAAQQWVPVEPLTTELPETWGGRRYAFGGNLGMRRFVFDDAGGFDETYGAGAEEIDFAWRALNAGHEVSFVPDAVIHYRLRSDLRGILRQQFNSGLGTAQVFATFRPPEATTRSWHRRIRHELLLLKQFPRRGGRVARGQWLSTLAFEAGKVRGAIRYRCPVP